MVTITRVNSVEGLGLWNLKSWLSFISPERGYLVKMLLVYKYLIIKSFPTSHHIFVICRIMVLYRTVQLYRMHATDKLQVSTQISFISTCTQSRIILLASTGFKLPSNWPASVLNIIDSWNILVTFPQLEVNLFFGPHNLRGLSLKPVLANRIIRLWVHVLMNDICVLTWSLSVACIR
jgi:hypothetical protein